MTLCLVVVWPSSRKGSPPEFCSRPTFKRGVCRDHHQMMKGFIEKGYLTDDWLVLRQRWLPEDGYAYSSEESLRTLPRPPKQRKARERILSCQDTRWIFDIPDSTDLRARLEGSS